MNSSGEWVHRRKHSIELLEPERVRNTVSVDFSPPDPLAPGGAGEGAPLFVVPKAPGKYSRFDVRDGNGSAVPLPSRAENERWSNLVLLEAAYRQAPQHFQNAEDKKALIADLRIISQGLEEAAVGRIINYWTSDDRPRRRRRRHEDLALMPLSERVQDGWRGDLARNDDFWNLLTMLASASVCVVPIADAGGRQIVKLSYDSLLQVVPRPLPLRIVRSLGIASGIRELRAVLTAPWIRARSFHFEVHAPAGMRVVASAVAAQSMNTSIRPTRPVHKHHDHIYVPRAVSRTRFVGGVWYRAEAAALGVPALLAAALVATGCFFAAAHSSWVSDNPQATLPAVLLAVPGLVAAVLSRPTHPVTVRLLAGPRTMLVLVALAAYLGAVRLAVSTTHDPASADAIEACFLVLGGVCAFATLWLLTIRIAALVSGMRVHDRRLVGDVFVDETDV